MSSRKMSSKKEIFELIAPEANAVTVVGTFSDWEKNPVPLKKQKNGLWKASIPLESGNHEYRFVVDGQWKNDPSCAQRVQNPFGEENCVRIVT